MSSSDATKTTTKTTTKATTGGGDGQGDKGLGGALATTKAGLDVMKQMKDVLTEEHSTTLGEVKQGIGFRSFTATTDREDSVVRTAEMAVDDVVEALERFGCKDAAVFQRVEEVRQELRRSWKKVLQHVSFAAGRGRGGFMAFSIQPIREGPDAGWWAVAYVVSTCDFEPAPSYCVVTETDKGFLYSSSTQRIQEFPADLKPEHLKEMAQLLSGQYAAQLLVAA